MVIIINGSFGVGKTTVAKILRQKIDEGVVFDPEKIGFVLRRLPAFFPFSGRNFDDYQDISLWRSLNIRLIDFCHRFRSSKIIVPMAFSNLDILNEFRWELEKKNIEIRHFCLTASQETIFKRLEKRGVQPLSGESQWIYRKATHCCQVHKLREYQEQINTEEKSPSEVADEIIQKLKIV